MLNIIGSGLAGFTLVREIRKLSADFPITLYTRDSGDYYSKPQLSTALTCQKSPAQLVLISAEKCAAQFNIKIMPHAEINSLDESPTVLATGANPKTLPNTYSVNNLAHYADFREALQNQKHITIIGAGLVGCEFANDLINTGYAVSITAPDPYPLARLVPEPIGLSLKNAFSEKGVQWRLGEAFNAAESRGITLTAIGIKPEVSLAQSAGLVVKQGIVVNSYLQTSAPHIYALGDCMEFQGRLMPYIAPIAIAARALAKTILGEPTPVIFPPMPIYVKTPAYPIVVLQPESPEGEWRIENPHKALFYHHNTLKGFALGSTCAAEAVEQLEKVKVSLS